MLCMDVCKKYCNYYQVHGKDYRQRHLRDHLKAAVDRGDEEVEKQILGIIKQEKERGFWRKLKFKMGKASGGSVQSVHVEDKEGNVEIFATQEKVHEAIWSNIHRKWFFLAETAPICSGELREMFGYSSDTAEASEVLARTFGFDVLEDATRDSAKRLLPEEHTAGFGQ
jgi:hypothetical protein